MWSFRPKKAVEAAPVISFGTKKAESTTTSAPSAPSIGTKSKNIFESLDGVDRDEAPRKPEGGKWGIGTKINDKKEEPKR